MGTNSRYNDLDFKQYGWSEPETPLVSQHQADYPRKLQSRAQLPPPEKPKT